MQSLRVRIAKLSSKSSKRNKSPDEVHYVELGRLGKPHGVRGELRFLPHAFPCPTLQKGLAVLLQKEDGDARPFTVERVRRRAPLLLVRFQGIASLEQAQALCNAVVAVEACWLPPVQEGEFYYYQMIGLQVLTTAGEDVGRIDQVFFSGGHDVWVVRQGKNEHLIPVTEEIVRSIDVAGGRVVIEPMEGLLD